jgi:hypothetical protein
VIRKVLAIAIVVLALARLLVLPRFAQLRKKLDRVINATLIALVLVYGVELLRRVF